MQTTYKNKILDVYSQIVALKSIQIKIEFENWISTGNETAQLTFYGIKNLKTVLKLVSCLGVHKLEKKAYKYTDGQYATGQNKDNDLTIYVHPEDGTFRGCTYIDVQEEIFVPETKIAATEEKVIPAHTEIITKKILKCVGE